MYLDRRKMMLAGGCAMAGAAWGGEKPSRKKGFGVATNKTPGWQGQLKSINAKWYYTWGAMRPENSPPEIEFIPMQWGKWGCSEEKMAAIKSRGHTTLLGFNEPDQDKQANISVEKALELWPLLMESGLSLGSPAGVHPDGEWMTAFMQEAGKRGYRIDFITMHSYMGKNAKHFLDKVERIHGLYNRPVWITEFAVADWTATADKPNKYTPDDVLGFMEVVLPALENMDCVERYAWYSGTKPPLKPSCLFNEDGSLNRLGEIYASI